MQSSQGFEHVSTLFAGTRDDAPDAAESLSILGAAGPATHFLPHFHHPHILFSLVVAEGIEEKSQDLFPIFPQAIQEIERLTPCRTTFWRVEPGWPFCPPDLRVDFARKLLGFGGGFVKLVLSVEEGLLLVRLVRSSSAMRASSFSTLSQSMRTPKTCLACFFSTQNGDPPPVNAGLWSQPHTKKAAGGGSPN